MFRRNMSPAVDPAEVRRRRQADTLPAEAFDTEPCAPPDDEALVQAWEAILEHGAFEAAQVLVGNFGYERAKQLSLELGRAWRGAKRRAL